MPMERKDVVAFNAGTHLLIGFAVGAALAHSPLELGLVLFGSLLPDVDHPKSTLGKFNLFNRFGMFKHRGKCHTILGAAVLSLPFFLVAGGWHYPLLVFAGALSHILGDKLASMFPNRSPFKIKVW
jgi:membrane-bound metal-dependent hydrolase YbcI (DUF457 family)